ncbi:hypothetical protein B5P53_24315 [Citrobacter portucalensis]|uniref:hypothetical protein n=1 Tax=Citrobacter portucalensis TaxID=1639133 RepID=UPI0009D636F9|nr:hypothetical protein [Citrobacter portucalensis]OPX47712.1 hypothetical protein B5P53_24315 [Citrobacter portucalensis]
MTIMAKNGNKKLLSSGIFNIEIDSDPSIEFDVYGLKVTLTIDLLSHDDEKKSTVNLDAGDDYVTIRHSLKQNSDDTLQNAGMIRPLDFATTANGKDIFISWYVIIKTTVDKVRIATISYSFYEAL